MALQIDQHHFRTVRLAGSVALTTPDLHWQEHKLPVAVWMNTEITADLPAVEVTVRDSRIDLADFQEILQAFFPQKTFTGTLVRPHLTVRGPALAVSEKPLRLEGTLTMDRVHLVDAANQLRLTDLDVTLTNLQGTMPRLLSCIRGLFCQPSLDHTLLLQGLQLLCLKSEKGLENLLIVHTQGGCAG